MHFQVRLWDTIPVMRITLLRGAVITACASLMVQGENAAMPSGGQSAAAKGPKIQQYLRLRLAFEHIGKGASERYVAHGQGYSVILNRRTANFWAQPRPSEDAAH